MPRIPNETRQAVIQDILDGKTRNDIARQRNISEGSVTNIAKDNGLTFDRAQIKNATEARQADNRARRAEIARKFLDKADELLGQIDEPHLVFNFGGKDNDYNFRMLPKPPTGDIRNLMIAAATAFDKHMAAEKHDSGTGADAAKSLLSSLGEALNTAAAVIPDDEP